MDQADQAERPIRTSRCSSMRGERSPARGSARRTFRVARARDEGGDLPRERLPRRLADGPAAIFGHRAVAASVRACRLNARPPLPVARARLRPAVRTDAHGLQRRPPHAVAEVHRCAAHGRDLPVLPGQLRPCRAGVVTPWEWPGSRCDGRSSRGAAARRPASLTSATPRGWSDAESSCRCLRASSIAGDREGDGAVRSLVRRCAVSIAQIAQSHGAPQRATWACFGGPLRARTPSAPEGAVQPGSGSTPVIVQLRS